MSEKKENTEETKEIVEVVEVVDEAKAVDAAKVTESVVAAEPEEEEEEEPIIIEGAFSMAIVRLPSPTLANGITSSDLGRPDYALFLQQHLSYTAVLRTLGLKIVKLPSLGDFPDAHFVEDVAVITPEIAVLARPGAAQRLGEIEHMRETLEEYSPLAAIKEPGTLDGGDVMQIEQKVFVGLSERTNKEGAAQLASVLAPFGYETHPIPLEEGLHLKSNVNFIGRNTLLVTEAWANHPLLAEYDKIVVPSDETYAANTLLVNNRLLTPMGFRGTQALLREAGFDILEIDATEMQKMDGGLSCMSLRFY